MSEYEKKLAVKRANADAKKAVRDWHKLQTVGIDDILKRMGYSSVDGIYKFKRRCRTGMEAFTICLDTYGLIYTDCDKINVEVVE